MRVAGETPSLCEVHLIAKKTCPSPNLPPMIEVRYTAVLTVSWYDPKWLVILFPYTAIALRRSRYFVYREFAVLEG